MIFHSSMSMTKHNKLCGSLHRICLGALLAAPWINTGSNPSSSIYNAKLKDNVIEPEISNVTSPVELDS